MKETDREWLRQLVLELTAGASDLSQLPAHKTGLVDTLRRLGREAEAQRIEYGAGFTLGADDGEVWIISGGRRERLLDLPEQGTP